MDNKLVSFIVIFALTLLSYIINKIPKMCIRDRLHPNAIAYFLYSNVL